MPTSVLAEAAKHFVRSVERKMIKNPYFGEAVICRMSEETKERMAALKKEETDFPDTTRGLKASLKRAEIMASLMAEGMPPQKQGDRFLPPEVRTPENKAAAAKVAPSFALAF